MKDHQKVWHAEALVRRLTLRSIAVAARMAAPVHVNPLRIRNISKMHAPVRIAMHTMMLHRHSPVPMQAIPLPSAPAPQGIYVYMLNCFIYN